MGDGKLSTEAACDSLKEIISNQHGGLYCAYVDCSDQVQAFLVFFFFKEQLKTFLAEDVKESSIKCECDQVCYIYLKHQ